MIRRWHILMVLTIAVPVAIVSYRALVPDGQTRIENASPVSTRVIESAFYHDTQFKRSVRSADSMSTSFPEDAIVAGIIPHDITQGQMIAHFFSELQEQMPQRIILIGPNHYERGGSLVTTTSATWRSGAGTTVADNDAVSWLTENNYAREDDSVAIDEHAVAAIVPFISHYLPDAKLVPLMLKAELQSGEIRSLANALDALYDKNTVVIAAVDFSHYLSAGQAAYNDQTTEQALKTLDYQTILSFGPRFNDYVDSPPSIALLLYWLQQNDVDQYAILEHTNSGIATGDMTGPVTSYFEMVYY